jgi:hypothetical protein
MSLFRDPSERHQAEQLAALLQANPFRPERLAAERAVLGADFVVGRAVWSAGEDLDNPNVERVAQRAVELVERLRRRLPSADASDEELALFRRVVFLVLYELTWPALLAELADRPTARPEAWAEFSSAHERLLGATGAAVDEPAHLFACIYQVRRAFVSIFETLAGGSAPAAELRAAAWRSVFGARPDRYRQQLYRVLPRVPTLVTGPTGTGKELVARAIGLAGYIPFDADEERFVAAPEVRSVQLSALPQTLVESELFGHRAGAFTGAVSDRRGWLADVPPGGAVFLDEIGDLDPVVQVKLLRVLESRRFTPLGSSDPRAFRGKVIAATHVDLPAAIEAGRFREDLYFRLCGDAIRTPTLRSRLDDDPDELRQIVGVLLAREVGEAGADWVDEVVQQVLDDRGAGWPWPGNVRELAQCVRRVLVQGHCATTDGPRVDGLGALAAAGRSLAEVQTAYVRQVYAQQGSYKAAGEVLGIDWRTVRSHVTEEQR